MFQAAARSPINRLNELQFVHMIAAEENWENRLTDGSDQADDQIN
jgi:hypothetical protein